MRLLRSMLAWFCVPLLLSGCIMIDTAVTPIDPTIQAASTGEDCVYMVILPVAIGETTVERAMANADPGPIVKVRSARIVSRSFPFIGWTCTAVEGEPKDWTPAKAAAAKSQPLSPGVNN